MSLRFAIIKHIKTLVGQEWEDVVYEYQAEKIYGELTNNLLDALPKKRFFLKPVDVECAFEKAWEKTINDFKKVTIRIM